MESCVKENVCEYIVGENLLDQLLREKTMSDSLARIYRASIKHYELYTGMSIDLLIQEADDEEEQKIRMKNRTLKNRLIMFRNYLLFESDLSTNSAKKYFSILLSFYDYFEIELPKLPRVKTNKDYHLKYEDIPKDYHIQEAINLCKKENHRGVINFMATSGTARHEVVNITVRDFFLATNEYHGGGSIEEMLRGLFKYDGEIIPLFSLLRFKTDYPYYTCCSPEATNSIIVYLLTKLVEDKIINLTDRLFDMSQYQIDYLFRKINTECNWGKVGYFNFFRTHMLRKRFATEIGNRDIVDALEGRKREEVIESYFIHNPSLIKEEYIKVMDKVRIYYEFEQDREDQEEDKKNNGRNLFTETETSRIGP